MKITGKKLVLFSGIQPSGNLTLGNYIGALKNWVDLQGKYDCLFSLVDLHTITARQDPKEFHQNCYDALAVYLAVGLDPEKNTIFLQSHVPAHSQLAWVLNCYAYVGELNRMTQFKDKSEKNKDNINVGLFTYPVLMAADILIYQTCLVPVGADQKQHVEIARDIALRFNNLYGEVFTVPEVYHPPLGARIMSLQEPTKKMSKSDDDSNATIFLLDTPDVIANKLKRAVTDSGKDIYFDIKNKPGVTNLLTILAAVTNESVDNLVSEMQGQGYGKLKSAVAERLIEFLRPVQVRYKELRNDQTYLDSVLKRCAKRAVELSQPTLKRVYEVLGFVSW
ncbi:MAG TPA: tryptophan--tRNA ligase [Coxiellaceae bacterium]|nr:MAG: tryptophan--tRNA ligase [Gammaproteobacteria bacterium RBG_16_37_9]HBC71389.1 tryptophan--tRNA ligase [Coxiellaceae bacterium]HBS52037.1 tryptophan--tRNA ligase [Coxiellaceae bacterium]